MARILVIEDESILRRNIVDRLRAEGHDVFDAGTGEAGLELGTLLAPDLVLTDLQLPGIDGLDVLRGLKKVSPRMMVVLITAHGSQKTALSAMREGAYDYLNKPVELKELVLLVERAVSHCRALDGFQYAQQAERAKGTLEQILGVSEHIRDIKARLRRLIASPALAASDPPSILITGETGTGKDVVARVLHYEGPRRDGPFVRVNCTAISEHLFESELFGHVRGAFLDARTSKKGLFEVADGGTVFLDEINHLGRGVQAKLLLAIETRRIRPVGSTQERSVNVQIIAATNRDLDEAVARGEFRADLFHRLKVLHIALLPLRPRRDDILPLAQVLLVQHARRFHRQPPSSARRPRRRCSPMTGRAISASCPTRWKAPCSPVTTAN